MVRYIPCTKLIFHVDNGLGSSLKGTRLAAEYDVLNKKVIWRKISKDKIRNQEYLSNWLILLSSLIPPTFFVFIIFFIRMLSKDVKGADVLGGFKYIIPMILGFLMFLSFEYLMIRIRSKYEICRPPSSNEQLLYFEGVEQIALKFNDVCSSNRIPYLANIIVSVFVLGLVLPIMFWLYFIPSSMGEFGMKLIILGLIISLIPNIGWNLVLKSIVLSKIKQDINEKIDAR